MAGDRPFFSKTDLGVVALVLLELAALIARPEPVTAAVVITISATVTITAQIYYKA